MYLEPSRQYTHLELCSVIDMLDQMYPETELALKIRNTSYCYLGICPELDKVELLSMMKRR